MNIKPAHEYHRGLVDFIVLRIRTNLLYRKGEIGGLSIDDDLIRPVRKVDDVQGNLEPEGDHVGGAFGLLRKVSKKLDEERRLITMQADFTQVGACVRQVARYDRLDRDR